MAALTLQVAPMGRWGRDHSRNHSRSVVLSPVELGIRGSVEVAVEEAELEW